MGRWKGLCLLEGLKRNRRSILVGKRSILRCILENILLGRFKILIRICTVFLVLIIISILS